VPAFEDVARLDGDATCISKEDLNQLMNSLQGPLAPEEKQVRTVVRVRMCMLHTRLLALTRAQNTYTYTDWCTPPAPPNPIQVKTVDSSPLGIPSVLYAMRSKVCGVGV